MDSLDAVAKHACATFALMEDQCSACGQCTARCSLLEQHGWNMRDVCHEGCALLSGDERTGDVRKALAGSAFGSFVLSCEGCNRCTSRCPQGLAMSTPWQRGRELMRAAGILDDATLRIVQVDCTWNTFSVYRSVQGIGYDDVPLLQAEPCDAAATGWQPQDGSAFPDAAHAETLFFPGCSLVTYAPQLTRKAFAWLTEHQGPCLLSLDCCASTLGFMGEVERAAAWKARVITAAKEHGVKRIVCVCPGCEMQLAPMAAEIAPDIQFVSLARLLSDAGVRIDAAMLGAQEMPVMVTDSCNDRARAHGDAIRELFANVDSVMSPCVGADARCCGAGGGVNLYNKAFARQRTRQSMDVGKGRGARILVTACPTCAYTYAFERWESAQEGDARWDGLSSMNYLEAVFNERIDWPAVFDSLFAMWQGEHAAWVAERIG